jgi:hypothetical protein
MMRARTRERRKKKGDCWICCYHCYY